MIITLQEGLGLHVVEVVIGYYQKQGCDVLVKNGQGDTVLFVGSINAKTARPISRPRFFGIKSIKEDNTFFVENHEKFVEASQYIALRERGEKQTGS